VTNFLAFIWKAIKTDILDFLFSHPFQEIAGIAPKNRLPALHFVTYPNQYL
jgi:hypothetical protein